MDTSIDTIELYNNPSCPPNKKKKKGEKNTKKLDKFEWPEVGQDFHHPDQVAWEVNDTDPGSFFTLASDEAVHAAMVDAPLPQGLNVGNTPDESAANLRAW